MGIKIEGYFAHQFIVEKNQKIICDEGGAIKCKFSRQNTLGKLLKTEDIS